MMSDGSHDILGMLREIEAHYRAKGASSPQNEIADALGVNQSAVSKWLTKKVRPDRHAVKIMALYYQTTGNAVRLPLVQDRLPAEIKTLVEIARELGTDERASVVDYASSLLSKGS
ncbi:helix-turn-helix transcriptional regulator [Agrobacterium tumefaciens]|uniref:helix-turn-helix domain-containing protein n=2 Tax=Agrobacterium tumefaciens TaxID=358 RepID=UPI0021CE5A1B|nr:helix-turn-helix transcriptional regulator [Agrobacterium tumefaciens]UXS09218.1 helix-turn-helix transcriptional regulator [Agrobacterium tumefaciens]UXS16577.1 helix-turn-helix transcriptional regulator [Agrobacterium tumefaciens]